VAPENVLNSRPPRYRLPRLNGLRVSEQVQAAHLATKFLFITGFADDFPEERIPVKIGVTFVKKPFLSQTSCVESPPAAGNGCATKEREKLSPGGDCHW
jgi:FixJ family two-component response regulator